MKPTVVFYVPAHLMGEMFRTRDLDRLREVATVVEPAELVRMPEAFAKAVAIVTGWGTPGMDRKFLDGAPNFKLLAHSAGSVKHLAGDLLFDHGVRVVTAAEPNAIPVAEFAVASIVSLLKQVPWISAAFARGDTDEVHKRWPHIRELADMNVGLVGASRIGRHMIRLLKSYTNLSVHLYDPYLPDAEFARLGVIKSTLETVCACEVVSIHAPNLPETRHMINSQTLALLPDHAVFINTSRGALIDEAALVAELYKRPIYALLDVTDPEPPEISSPLRTAPNLLLTPHIAGAMRQARKEMGKVAIDETIRFLNGQPLQHEVTRAMLATQA